MRSGCGERKHEARKGHSPSPHPQEGRAARGGAPHCLAFSLAARITLGVGFVFGIMAGRGPRPGPWRGLNKGQAGLRRSTPKLTYSGEYLRTQPAKPEAELRPTKPKATASNPVGRASLVKGRASYRA